MFHEFFGISRPEPSTATGTTGTRAFIASANKPFLKGITRSSSLRVPSGKTAMLFPPRICSPASSRDLTASRRLFQSTNTNLANHMYSRAPART